MVSDDERCLPACTMRRLSGVERLVRRASRERRVLIEVFEGIVRGIVLFPDTVLTKICIVSSVSELEELMLLMLDVRRMVAVLGGGWRGDDVVASGDDAGRGDLVG